MKGALPGAKWSPSALPTDQIVEPATGLTAASVQRNAVPPHACTSMPRCLLYQACSAAGSLAWKKTPPMPVTRFIGVSRSRLVGAATARDPLIDDFLEHRKRHRAVVDRHCVEV